MAQRTCDLLANQKTMQRHFFPILHPLPLVIFATATAFVLLRNPRFNFHCYTQHEATHTQKSAHNKTHTDSNFTSTWWEKWNGLSPLFPPPPQSSCSFRLVIFLLMVHSPDLFPRKFPKIFSVNTIRDRHFCMALVEQVGDDGRWYMQLAAIWHLYLPLFICITFGIRWNGLQYLHALALCALFDRGNN